MPIQSSESPEAAERRIYKLQPARLGLLRNTPRRAGQSNLLRRVDGSSESSMKDATKVLIIDDDPTHLKIYGWIVSAAGYEALPALVTADRIDFPECGADLVLMDYRLTRQITAVEAVAQIRSRYSEVPIIVLSDLYDLPADVAPLVQSFVRKGEPAQLVNTLARFAGAGAVQSDGAA